MELYKKYRPTNLAQMVGNQETVAILEEKLAEDTLPHAILLTGPSGSGKTTLARILRTSLGCGEMDYTEVNSASNRGIDTMRDVQRLMNLSPASGKCRIWLFDEVHKWSNDAQNAALKMLEDTPSHVYFFLCTTDPQKLIKAVLTRCSPMPLRALTYQELGLLLDRVCKAEKIKLEKNVQDELISSSMGSARSLLVLLDNIAGLKPSQQQTAIAEKLAQENEAIDLCRALINKDSWKKIAGILSNLKGEPEETRWAVLGYARAVLLKSENHQAYLVLDCFKNHFYDSKAAGLALACFEACKGS